MSEHLAWQLPESPESLLAEELELLGVTSNPATSYYKRLSEFLSLTCISVSVKGTRNAYTERCHQCIRVGKLFLLSFQY